MKECHTNGLVSKRNWQILKLTNFKCQILKIKDIGHNIPAPYGFDALHQQIAAIYANFTLNHNIHLEFGMESIITIFLFGSV